MRRILALGCCAAYLVFGFMAGVAHVHGSADHHEESRGLHLDHGHLIEPSDHEHHHDHARGVAGDREARRDTRRLDHQDGDALYLKTTAARSIGPKVRLMPAIVSTGKVIAPPSSPSERDDAISSQPRDPPRKIPPRLRAPPA